MLQRMSIRWAPWMVILIGSALRAARYGANRSLWGDEAALALNVMDRSIVELLGPLGYAQAAPYGFLVAQKGVIEAFGASEAALRLIPFLASLVSLPLVWWLAKSILSRPAALFALVLFALGDTLIYYSAEAKQYALDVPAAMVVLCLGQRIRVCGATARRLILFGLAGIIGVWFSHPLAFVCAGVGLTLIVWAYQRGERRTCFALIAVAASWLVSFLLNGWFVLRHTASREHLTNLWQSAFMPIPLFMGQRAEQTMDAWAWYPRTFFGVFDDPIGLGAPTVAAAAFLGGVVVLWRHDRAALGLIAMPIVAAMLVSAFGLYPFGTNAQLPPYGTDPNLAHPPIGRFILFTVPLWIIVLSTSLGALWSSPRRGAAVGGLVLAAALLFFPAKTALTHLAAPPDVHDVRGLMIDLAARLRPSDVVMVHSYGRRPVMYYHQRLGWSQPLRFVQFKDRSDLPAWQELLGAAPPGTRYWLISVHHPRWRLKSEAEQQDIIKLMHHYAKRRDQLDRLRTSAILFTTDRPQDRAHERQDM